VLYVAMSPAGAFVGTFLREPGRTLLPTDLLVRKAYVQMRVLYPLRLIKLGGPGLAIIGATAEVVHGGLPYDVPQAWSAALHGHPSAPDGISYTARHDDEAACCALFDRTLASVIEIERRTALDEDWFWAIAEPYRVGLAPT
jgi:RES domain